MSWWLAFVTLFLSGLPLAPSLLLCSLALLRFLFFATFLYLSMFSLFLAQDKSWEPEENVLNCNHFIRDFETPYVPGLESAARGASVRN